MRGNRTTKINSEGFNAFRSFNLNSLAHAGIHIKYDNHLIRRPADGAPFKPHFLLDNNVMIMTLFPGIRKEVVDTCFSVKGLRAVVLKPTALETHRKSRGSLSASSDSSTMAS